MGCFGSKPEAGSVAVGAQSHPVDNTSNHSSIRSRPARESLEHRDSQPPRPSLEKVQAAIDAGAAVTRDVPVTIAEEGASLPDPKPLQVAVGKGEVSPPVKSVDPLECSRADSVTADPPSGSGHHSLLESPGLSRNATRQPSFTYSVARSERSNQNINGSFRSIKDGLLDIQCLPDQLKAPLVNPSDPLPQVLFNTYGLTDPGLGRSENQDSYMSSTFRDSRGAEVLLTAVFDGHGAEGAKCSKLCTDELRRLYDEQFSLDMQAQFTAMGASKFGSAGWPAMRTGAMNLSGSMGGINGRNQLMNLEFNDREERVLNLLFHALEEALREECNTVLSGTTGSVCLLKKGMVWLASVGDSTAVLVSRDSEDEKPSTCILSGDHRLSNENEKARVLAAGARVSRRGNATKGHLRIWLKELDTPGLMVTRSLGDTIGKTVGVTNEPEVNAKELDPEDRFIIIGSDGVWDVVSAEEAADMVLGAGSLEAATEQLVKESLARWQAKKDETEAKYNRTVSGIGDNVTAVIVDLEGWKL